MATVELVPLVGSIANKELREANYIRLQWCGTGNGRNRSSSFLGFTFVESKWILPNSEQPFSSFQFTNILATTRKFVNDVTKVMDRIKAPSFHVGNDDPNGLRQFICETYSYVETMRTNGFALDSEIDKDISEILSYHNVFREWLTHSETLNLTLAGQLPYSLLLIICYLLQFATYVFSALTTDGFKNRSYPKLLFELFSQSGGKDSPPITRTHKSFVLRLGVDFMTCYNLVIAILLACQPPLEKADLADFFGKFIKHDYVQVEEDTSSEVLFYCLYCFLHRPSYLAASLMAD